MKKNLPWIIGIIVIAIAIGAVAYLNYTENPSQSGSEVRIGFAAALTGPVAFWADSVLQGMQLATEEYNAENPEKPARIIFEDNAGEIKNQIAAMRKLCTTDDVTCVVSILTPYSKPIRPLAEQLKTPVLGTVVASLNFGAENEWSFRDYPTPDQLSAKMAEYAFEELGFRKAVSIVVNDEYGTDSLKIFKETFEKIGGQVLGSDTVMQTDTDMRAQVTKLIQMNPECVFLVIRENALGIAVRQFRELGFKGQILGINAFDSPVVWDVCGPHGEGIIFTSVLIDYEGNPKAAAFAKAFSARYSQEPMHTHAYGYSIANYLIPFAAESHGDGEKMRELLASMQADSIRGQIKMLPSRDVLSGVAIYKRQGGKNVIIAR